MSSSSSSDAGAPAHFDKWRLPGVHLSGVLVYAFVSSGEVPAVFLADVSRCVRDRSCGAGIRAYDAEAPKVL